MSRPWPDEVPLLADAGIVGVLSLTESVPEGLPAPGLFHCHVPVRDFSPPTVSDFAEAIAFMDQVVQAGGAVAVHCGAGLGRTGTVIAAWLVKQGWSPADAMREVRRRRPGSIETREQEASIFAFGKSLRGPGMGDKA